MGDEANKYKKLPQIICGLGACMGGFCAGTGLGWGSGGLPLLREVRKERNKDSDEDYNRIMDAFIISIFNWGAIVSLIITIFVMNRLGRKWTMLISLPLGAVVWIVTSLVMLDPVQLVMRFLIGVCIGVYGSVCPVYVGEIASKEIRGTILVFFQLLITMGILYSYALAFTKDFLIFNLAMIIPIVIMVVWIVFIPESPFFLLERGKEDAAKEVLQKLRGKNYNIDAEFKEMNLVVQKGKETQKFSFKEMLTRKPLRRAFWTGILLMSCQQLCGINAVIFNMQTIFESTAGEKGKDEETVLSPMLQSVIVGVVQVLATGVASIVADRAGRRLLMMVSMFFMGIGHALLFIFFLLRELKGEDFASTISWLPLIGLCVFIIAFSLGAGPMPWAIVGEIYAEEIKHVAANFTVAYCWLLSFIVTWVFEFGKDAAPPYTFFVIFCALCALGLVGIVFFLLETKNRTFEEIQAILEGNNPEMAPIGFKK